MSGILFWDTSYILFAGQGTRGWTLTACDTERRKRRQEKKTAAQYKNRLHRIFARKRTSWPNIAIMLYPSCPTPIDNLKFVKKLIFSIQILNLIASKIALRGWSMAFRSLQTFIKMCYYYLRQWNEVNWRRLWGWPFCSCVCLCLSVCLSVCVHELAEICTITSAF